MLANEESVINPDTKEPFADNWPAGIYAKLKSANIQQIAVVPDAGHSQLIRLCEGDPEMTVVRLTTEEEGIALLGGAWLGGQRGVLLMQSSGVGNCINMLSLPNACQFPLLMIVTMRGDWGEFNPMQVFMGNATQVVLESMNVIVRRADRPEDVVDTVGATLDLAINTCSPTATLIGQRVLGAKNFKELAK